MGRRGEGPDQAERLVDEAEALLDEGRIDDALAAYDRALAAGKDDVEVLLGAADLYVNRLPDDARDHEALERGIGLARAAARLARKAGDDALQGEAAWLEGAALTQLGRPAEALPRLDLAAKALPEAVEVALEQGIALHELCRWDDAREALLRAEALDRDDPWVQHQLGLVAERRGDRKRADGLLARARKIDPEDFPPEVAVDEETFRREVREAIAALPEDEKRSLATVPVEISDLPEADDLLAVDPPLSPSILGLFRGPSDSEPCTAEDGPRCRAIVFYRRNLVRFARDKKELENQVRVTLLHELGHLHGEDDDQLRARGLE